MKNLILTLTILLFSATSLFAATITVTSNADTGAGTLRQAVTDADNGDVIVFAEDITTVYFAGMIIIDKNITISGNATNNTIIQNAAVWTDTANKKRYFEVLSNATVTFNHLTLKDNTANCTGGAMINRGNLTLNNCTFSNNRTYDYGGAIYSEVGTLIVKNCVFNNNYAPSAGGGIFNNKGKLTVTNSSFSGNYGYNGGAINTSGENTLVSNCIFEENSSPFGSAIYNNAKTNIEKCKFKKNNSTNSSVSNSVEMTIIECVFTENTITNNSQGVFYSSGKATITNCAFFKNTARNTIVNNGNNAILNLINSTVAYNTAKGVQNNAGTANLHNNILVKNEGTIFKYDVENSGGQVIFSNNLIGRTNNFDGYYFGHTPLPVGEGDIIGEDPLFFDVENGDYRLQENSPAIDSGNNDYFPAEITKDLFGNPRISNGTIDMGAYEYQQMPTAINTISSEKEKTIIGYYNTLGQRLSKEPTNGIYIIMYDNGTSEKKIK